MNDLQRVVWRAARPAIVFLITSWTAVTAQTQTLEVAPGIIYVTSYHGDGRATCSMSEPGFREALERRGRELSRRRRALSAPGIDRSERADSQETFELILDGFTPEAEAAFRRAVEIWEAALSVKVPVEVTGVFEDLGSPNTLGSGGPGGFVRGFVGQPQPGVWYPFALANQLAGFDVFPDDSDIDTAFNSTFTDLYFGLDGFPPPGQFDFVSIVLHELGHGLGLADSACHNPESDNCPGTVGDGDIGFGGDNAAGIFDTFLENAGGVRLIDLPRPSAELGAALIGNDVFFGGALTTGANGGSKVKLWAPTPFDPGSSIAHLDEFAFPESGGDGLMTPFISRQEVVQEVGPATLAVYEDMGWIVVAERLLHFAQFGAGGGLTSAVVVTNVSETLMASGQVDFFDPAGTPIAAESLVGNDGTFVLPPRATKTFSTTDVGDLVEGSAVVRSDRLVSGVLRFNIAIDGKGAAGVGSALVAPAVITPIRREGTVSTGIAIRNVGEDSVTVSLELYDQDGTAVGDAVEEVIPGNGRISKFAREFFGTDLVTPGFRGSVIVRVVGQGQVAVIALELGGPGEFITLPVVAVG